MFSLIKTKRAIQELGANWAINNYFVYSCRVCSIRWCSLGSWSSHSNELEGKFTATTFRFTEKASMTREINRHTPTKLMVLPKEETIFHEVILSG